jgi:hypothetical protein
VKDAPQEGKLERAILWTHAFAAISTVAFMAYQFLSGLTLSLSVKKEETLLRKGHRFNGRFTAVLWTLVIITGYAATHRPQLDTSDEYKQKMLLFGISTHFSGVSMLVNLWNGIRAVTGPKESRDYLLHKGSMYFTFVGVAFMTGAPPISVNTLIALFPDCPVQDSLQILLISIFFSLQVLGSLLAGCHWGGPAFRRQFVKYNFYFLVLQVIVFWGAAVYVMANITPPEEAAVLRTAFSSGGTVIVRRAGNLDGKSCRMLRNNWNPLATVLEHNIRDSYMNLYMCVLPPKRSNICMSGSRLAESFCSRRGQKSTCTVVHINRYKRQIVRTFPRPPG